VPVTVGHNPPVPTFFFPFTPNPSPKKPKNLKPNTIFFFFSKILVLTLGSPPEKGGKKKKKKKKKKEKRKEVLSVDLKQKKKKRSCPSRSRNLDFRTWVSGLRRTDRQTHYVSL
jgi:hypothetical protein